MSQVTIRRPFGELNLGDQLRFEPHAVFHFFLGQSPLSALLLGQIDKRARADSGFPSGLQNKVESTRTPPDCDLAHRQEGLYLWPQESYTFSFPGSVAIL